MNKISRLLVFNYISKWGAILRKESEIGKPYMEYF